MFRVGFSLS